MDSAVSLWDLQVPWGNFQKLLFHPCPRALAQTPAARLVGAAWKSQLWEVSRTRLLELPAEKVKNQQQKPRPFLQLVYSECLLHVDFDYSPKRHSADEISMSDVGFNI